MTEENLHQKVSGAEKVTLLGRVPIYHNYKSERGCEICKELLEEILKEGGYNERGDKVSFELIFENKRTNKEGVIKRELCVTSFLKPSIRGEDFYVDVVYAAKKAGYPDESGLSYKVRFLKKKE